MQRIKVYCFAGAVFAQFRIRQRIYRLVPAEVSCLPGGYEKDGRAWQFSSSAFQEGKN
jgi:hypothetical protein